MKTSSISVSDLTPVKMDFTNKLKTVCWALMFVGVLVFFIAVMADQKRAWHAYLIGLFYFTSISIGGLFFTAIQHVTGAGWSVNVRRLCESFTAFLPVSFVAALILAVVGGPHLYEWLHPEMVANDHLLAHKSSYLNRTFYLIRTVGIFAIWLYFAKVIVGASLKQDETGEDAITVRLVKSSVIFLLLFALSYSFFSVDAIMSLQAHFFSTIFGVYCFSGLFQTTMATMILIAVYLMKTGRVNHVMNENHLHDLGKFMFAFTVFWAYIAFSQFMLIWYANLPEETFWFQDRTQGAWALVAVALIVFKFIVPFFALLPRWAKRNPAHLVAVSILTLVMQYVDLYWLIYPALGLHSDRAVASAGGNIPHAYFGVYEVCIFLGFLGAFMFMVIKFLSRHSVYPYKDPRIHESLAHEVIY